jgi:predicted aspartyl protease
MSFAFDPQQGLIVIQAELEGPSGIAVLRLALDTGATGTLINIGMLVSIGYDPALSPNRVQVTTGSGVEFVPRIALNKITALGQERADFTVLCHTLPPSASVDGLLGLDFFRGQILSIDFQNGEVTLA